MELTTRLLSADQSCAPEPKPAFVQIPVHVLLHEPETIPLSVIWKLVLKTPALQMSKSKEEQLSFTWIFFNR